MKYEETFRLKTDSWYRIKEDVYYGNNAFQKKNREKLHKNLLAGQLYLEFHYYMKTQPIWYTIFKSVSR